MKISDLPFWTKLRAVGVKGEYAKKIEDIRRAHALS
jgi:hypothetical protein